MNCSYCDKVCPIGRQASKDFLDSNNSAYDAAMDFLAFVENCFRTCPYKDKHLKEKV